MNLGIRVAGSVGIAGVLLVFPVAAQARTKVVDVGLPVSAQTTFQSTGGDVNDFFPHGVTIHVGDRIRFQPTGEFHTVDLPKRGQGALPFAVPTGQAVAGVTDAAGVPFWFNGFPQIGFNPPLLHSNFGKRVRYNGSRRRESGISAGATKPFTVRFTKVGKYTYFCDIHAGMKGTVRVLRRKRHIPSAKADQRAVNHQVTRDFKIAQALDNTNPAAGTVDIGSAGRHGVEVFAMFPKTLTVAVGTTLRFQITSRSMEVHTASFGPNDYLNKLAGGFQQPVFDPRAVYPSDPPGTSVLVTHPTKTHGNGFVNTGLVDSNNATPLASFNVIKFASKGTYKFMCLVHPFMQGTIKVK